MGHLTVVSDRTARDFSKFGAVCAVAHDMFKTFIMFWHASPHQKFKPLEISDLAFVLTSSCLISSCFALFSMGSLPKNAVFPRMLVYYWSSTRLHSWSHTFPTIQ